MPKLLDVDDDFYADEKCHRCGVCCGATDGHPCEHLKHDSENYFCEVYENRFGIHSTTTGRFLRCVPIRQVIETDGGYSGCAYVQELKELAKRGHLEESPRSTRAS